MALRYVLTNKRVVDQGNDNVQVAYTCTISDELEAVVIEDTVSGEANGASPQWADICAAQIATDINVLLQRADEAVANEQKTEGLADKIAALLGGS